MKDTLKRVTVNLKADNYDLLNSYLADLGMTAPCGINKSYLVNALIKAFCPLSKELNQKLYVFCCRLSEQAKAEAASDSGEFSKAELEEQIKELDQLIDLFNHFSLIRLKPDQQPTMRSVHMKNRTAYFPEDDTWITLNENEAFAALSAYVVEAESRESGKTLHLVYFDHEPAQKIKEGFQLEKPIYRLCRKKSSEFVEIEKELIPPMYGDYDSNGCRQILNKASYAMSSRVTIFNFPVYGECSVYPYNAMIVPDADAKSSSNSGTAS